MAANGKAAILTDIINGIERWRWLVRLARSLAGSLMIDGRQPRRLIVQSRRLEIRKPAENCRLQKLEVRDRMRELLQATLPVGNFVVTEVMVMAVECLPGQIFIGAGSKSDRGSRQEIVNPSSETRLLSLRSGQSSFDRKQDRPDTRAISLGVAIGRARFKFTLRCPTPKNFTAYGVILQIGLSWLGKS
jgi:hypothetical protein